MWLFKNLSVVKSQQKMQNKHEYFTMIIENIGQAYRFIFFIYLKANI